MVAQSVAEIISDHVTLTVEGIDRMYLNVYVPKLQYEYGAVQFFREHRGQPLASSALMQPMTRSFVAALDRFIADHAIPVERFSKGQRKDGAHLIRRRPEGPLYTNIRTGARYRPSTAGKILGTARGDEPGAPAARSGQAGRSPRSSRADLLPNASTRAT